MAVIDTLPPTEVILRMKGTLDFYVYKGLVCVRSWPRSPALPRAPLVASAAAAFAKFSKALALTDPLVTNQATTAAIGQPWTWKDILTSAAYGNLNLPQ